MTRAWWRSRRRAAREKTRADFASAERITSGYVESLPLVISGGRAFWFGAVAALVALSIGTALGLFCLWIASVAFAAEAVTVPGGESVSTLKQLGTEHGLLGLLLSIAIAAIIALFTLLMKAGNARELALKTAELAHNAEMKAKDTAHAQDRSEWYAQIQLLQEARVGQLREVLTGLTNATTMMQNVQSTISERSQTTAEMTSKMGELVMTVQSLRTSCTEDTASLRKIVSSMADEVEAMRRAVLTK